MKRLLWLALLLLRFPAAAELPPGAEPPKPATGMMEIPLDSPPCAGFWLYVPQDYDATKPYDLLVFFTPHGTNDAMTVDDPAWQFWAQHNQVILLSPKFQNNTFFDPASGSDKAVLAMLDAVRKDYKTTPGVILFGSWGSTQFVQRIAWLHPDMVRLVAGHSGTGSPPPEKKAKGIPFVLTVGGEDKWLKNMWDFHAQLRKNGNECSLKVFPGMPHADWGTEAQEYSMEALRYYLRIFRLDPKDSKTLAKAREGFLLVGDRSTGLFYRADQKEAKAIKEEDRVEFTSPELAKLWGTPGANCKIPDKVTLDH